MIKADSKRKREFYTNYIYRFLNEDLSPQYQSGHILGEKELNDLINKNISEKSKRKKFIREATRAYNESLLEDRYFNWINKERIALYVIQFIYNNVYGNYFSDNFIRPNSVYHYPLCEKTPHMSRMGLPMSPSGLKELRDTIKLYFDRLSTPPDLKEVLMDNIKSIWSGQNKEWFSWIDSKDKNQIDWSLKYLGNHFQTDDDVLYYYKLSSPSSEIYGFLDICLDSNAERELFIIKMKKAWAQSRYRESVKDKKVINTYVSNDVKEKLKEIVRSGNKKTTEVISDLIRREYDRLKKR